MHYYGAPLPVSADYFGRFAAALARRIGAEQGGDRPFVGIMSQGTSGDQMWMDYGRPKNDPGLDRYCDEVAESAFRAYKSIAKYHERVPLAMAEATLTLRPPRPGRSPARLGRDPSSPRWATASARPAEVYAKEAIFLHDEPVRELKLQAIRIGELGIAAIPNEVYALTGLKIKARSPLPTTMNIELANGSEGYIPPPEQHVLGGYTTWPARTAGLEVQAEPKIVEASLHLLEQAAGKPRRKVVDDNGDYVEAVLAARPSRYWRLNEFQGPTAGDATGHGHQALYEGAVAFHLDGPRSRAFSKEQINRAPHFAGGRLNSQERFHGDTYSVELWFWNGLPPEARAVTGYLFSLGANRDHLFIGGTSGPTGRLGFAVGRIGEKILAGKSLIRTKAWNHVVLVRREKEAVIYLNGQLEMSGEAEPGPVTGSEAWLAGGSQENQFNFEGKIDEVARYDMALSPEQVAEHFKISGLETPMGMKAAPPEPDGAYVQAVLALKPLAYWRLGENGAGGGEAGDASTHGNRGVFEENIELYQEGPPAETFSKGATNRAPEFVGGRLKATPRNLGSAYTVSLWFWNELPNDARPVTGYMFSRGSDGAAGAPGDHLGIGGTHERHEGRLLFFNGNQLNEVLTGSTVIEPRSWNNAVMVREGNKVRVYLNGNLRPEIIGEAEVGIPASVDQIYIGGRNDNFANFQGRIDEVSVFNRALTADEAASLYKTSGLPAKPIAVPAPPPKLSSPPKSPEESRAMLQVGDGYEVELVAAEPLVASPVAIDWGVDGKLWVVEMADYPMGMDGKMKPGGRVRLLEDTHGDGHFDKSTVFLDGLNFPNGIIAWRKGVVVTAAPDIFYAEDTDGDGKADRREPLYTGFTEGNLQLRVNGLRWGLDNWLHCANGWSGGRPVP